MTQSNKGQELASEEPDKGVMENVVPDREEVFSQNNNDREISSEQPLKGVTEKVEKVAPETEGGTEGGDNKYYTEGVTQSNKG